MNQITEITPAAVEEESRSQDQTTSLTPAVQLEQTRKSLREATEDRDRLFKILDRRTLEIERLESELQTAKQQLATAIDSKCAALAKCEDLQQRSIEVEFKERRMEQERLLLQNQVEMLSKDVSRNVTELQNLRRESSARIVALEAKLHEKCEELSIVTMQAAQLRESNENLAEKVRELSHQSVRVSEEFAVSVRKYQAELQAKSRLCELYKSKSEDAREEQQEVADVVAKLREALREATEEFGKLETRSKTAEVQRQLELEAKNGEIEHLRNELKHANNLLAALKQDNIDIAVEKVCPSAARSDRHSISAIYTMYMSASEDCEQLTAEHEELKRQFAAVVDEIKSKAPQIQRTQVELSRLQEEHAEVLAQHDALRNERLDAQEQIKSLLVENNRMGARVKELQQERSDLSQQVCTLLSVVEGRSAAASRRSGDFVMQTFGNFRNVEELQQNNMQLMKLVRELSTAVEELEKRPSEKTREEVSKDVADAECQTEPLKAETSGDLKEKVEAQKGQIEGLKAQLSALQTQHAETQATNFKLHSQHEQAEGRLKLQQKNFEQMKRKLQSVEDKAKNLSLTSAKLETSLLHLREQHQDALQRLSRAEAATQSLTKENRCLTRSEAELRSQNEFLQKNSQLNSHLLTNVEFIRASIERIESEASATKLREKCEELERELESEKALRRDYETQAHAEMEQLESELQLAQDEIAKLNEILEVRTCESEKLAAKLQMLSEKCTKDEEVQSDGSESDPEMARLKSSVSQLRKIGKKYRDECLEAKNQLESARSSIEELKARNSELSEALKKDESMKNLLSKARSMITKLSEEKEELSEQLKRLKDESRASDDFESCRDLTVVSTVSAAESRLSFAEEEIVKTSTKKRLRDAESDESEREGGEKRVKDGSEDENESTRMQIDAEKLEQTTTSACHYPHIE